VPAALADAGLVVRDHLAGDIPALDAARIPPGDGLNVFLERRHHSTEALPLS